MNDRGSEFPINLMDLYFARDLPVTKEMLTTPLSDETRRGNFTTAYLIGPKPASYPGEILKVLNEDNAKLEYLARNVAILQNLGGLYLESRTQNGEPAVPYLITAGKFQGRAACVESFMPHIKGSGNREFIRNLPNEKQRLFILKSYLLSYRLEEEHVIQIDGKLDGLGFNPDTDQVSMVDFGTTYSSGLEGLGSLNYDYRKAVTVGTKSLSHQLAKVTEGNVQLVNLHQAVTHLEETGAPSFWDAFIEVQKAKV